MRVVAGQENALLLQLEDVWILDNICVVLESVSQASPAAVQLGSEHTCFPSQMVINLSTDRPRMYSATAVPAAHRQKRLNMMGRCMIQRKSGKLRSYRQLVSYAITASHE